MRGWTWVLFGAAAVGTSVVVVRGYTNAVAREAALLDGRAQSAILFKLQDANRRLLAEQIPAARRKQLEFKHAEVEGLRMRIEALKRSEARAEVGEAQDDTVEPDTLPSSGWIYAGSATPRAAIESVLWAASHGDVDHLSQLLGLSDDVHSKADALFSQLPSAAREEYGSPERVVATLLAGSFPKDATAMTIIDDQHGEQESDIAMRVDHSSNGPRTGKFSLRKTSGGWQLMVPASVMAGYEKTLLGDQQPTEAGTP